MFIPWLTIMLLKSVDPIKKELDEVHTKLQAA